MAEAEAEAAFLSSMQALNEKTGNYGDTAVTSTQQIDSSDEYDPAQDVQDVSMPPGPQNLSTQASLLDESNPNTTQSLSASVAPTPNASTPMADMGAASSQVNVGDTTNMSAEDAFIQSPRSKPPSPIHASAIAVATSSSDSGPNTGVPTITSNGSSTQANSMTIPSQGPVLQIDAPKNSEGTNAVSKPRLPHDRIGILEDRIKEDEKGDLDAWLGLIAELRKRGKVDEVRKAYERFFVVFPMAVSSSLLPLKNVGRNHIAWNS